MAEPNPNIVDDEENKDLNQEDDQEDKKPDESQDDDQQDNAAGNDDDDSDEEDQDDDAGDGDDEEEEPKPPSRREQLRIQQVLAKLKEDGTSKKGQPSIPDALDYKEALDADDDVVEKLKTDRDSFGEKMYQQGLEQALSIRFQTRLEVDAPRVEAKYPQLDKTSDKFNPNLALAINQMYLSAVGWDEKRQTVRNADIRYSDYVESMFELASEMAGEQTEAARTSIKRQAATTGIRPGGGGKKLNLNKAPEQMTDEELEAVIKASLPPQKR